MTSSSSAIASPQQFYLKLGSNGIKIAPFNFEDGANDQFDSRAFTVQMAPATRATSDAKATAESKPARSSHTVLRQWKPNDHPNGYGADILMTQDLNESDLITLTQTLGNGHDPVVIRIFSSRAAYEAEKNKQFGDVYARGYILFYVKNLTGEGAYRGFNEIRWMQEKGKFSSKFGTKTKL
jgi:hypothetical protein